MGDSDFKRTCEKTVLCKEGFAGSYRSYALRYQIFGVVALASFGTIQRHGHEFLHPAAPAECDTDIKVEVATVAILPAQLLWHADDGINMLRPSVHCQLHVASEVCLGGIEREGKKACST